MGTSGGAYCWRHWERLARQKVVADSVDVAVLAAAALSSSPSAS